MRTTLQKFSWYSVMLGLVLAVAAIPRQAFAQDQSPDDPPGRVARLGYMEGSVSFQPAGEQDWVGAVENRPMTTGDKLWADKDSRAEVQLGSAVIRLAPETGFSFLNLDDNTVQIQLTSGTLNITVRRLDDNNDFEIDTPNLAFTVSQPGHYRFEASEDGTWTAINIREGEGEATGNGQTYTMHAGQRGTFSGTDSLNADVEQLGGEDQFDSWADTRDHRHDYSRSSHYLAPDVVGYDDLDDNGDWRDDSNYGHVWYPSHVDAGWAPYHEGHWDWVSPWGWTWIDDEPWGYAPFHYGRWVSVEGRWGWVAGPVAVRAVYAPALVVFIGGSPGGFGGNVGWFPLGPREVYVPSYHVSEGYVNRVNVSNTTVNVTQVTNVYRTTIVNNNTTNITNVTYANRNVQGAVMVVPQHAFTSAQPVAKARVQVSAQQIASAPLSGRVAVVPTRESVLGSKAATAGRVTAPPPAVANRQVVAKKTPPPPPVPFEKQQQALAAHPGQPLARTEVQNLRPAAAAAAHPMVKVAPPGKPATATTGHPANQPGNAGRPGQPANAPANQPGNAGRPGQPAAPPANQPGNRPGAPPANERAAEPNRAAPTQPNNRPEAAPNRPAEAPARNDRPPSAQPNNRPAPAQPNNKPEATPNRPPAAQPNNRPEATPNRPPAAQPNNRPEATPNRPPAAQPNNRPEATPNRPPAAQPNNRPASAPPANRPEPAPSRPEATPPAAQPNNRPEQNRPAPPARNDRPPAAQPNNRPEPSRNEPAPRQTPPPSERPPQQQHAAPPPAARPAPQQQQHPQPKPQTPEEKKKQEEQKKPQ
jgi:hypothetical protein